MNETYERHAVLWRSHHLPTPCLTIDLDVIATRYHALRAVLPQARIYYAVKANPHPAIVSLLARLGSHFDVASRAEIDICLDQGAAPEAISYGNTIKRTEDIAYAHRRGVNLFAFDSEAELRKIANSAPGADVFCRLLVDGGDSALWRLNYKFGCADETAIYLLTLAADLGLRPLGVSWHVGSQQLDPTRWEAPISRAAEIFTQLQDVGIAPALINLGGGFPADYSPHVPGIDRYGKAISTALHDSFGDDHEMRIIAEPGRFLVGDAGVLRSRVVLVDRKGTGDDRRRWIYLDVGRFGGLAETEGEAIVYPLATTYDDSDDIGPAVIAGPTCDGVDIPYRQTPRFLPMQLSEGDYVDFLCAGAYTASYSTRFNGFAPLPCHAFPDPE
ncbi:type III PLP-dependent enzyme [Spirillospora sp. CA-128828]|uniref:type III PLP-dependent enzyme n=1 Tax=Spirillospora sp. CA-128828 TaxID=3240033 RepID=UPI003D91A488